MEGFETQRLIFRRISAEDKMHWVQFFEDPASFRYWAQERKPPEVECEEWYTKQWQRYTTNRGGMHAVLEKLTGRLAGHAGLLIQQVDGKIETEVAYSFLSNFRMKGYATEAARACLQVGFNQYQCQSLISIISVNNKPSIRVAEKNGMKVSATTLYNNNEVHIFRLSRDQWVKESGVFPDR